MEELIVTLNEDVRLTEEITPKKTDLTSELKEEEITIECDVPLTLA